MAGIYDFIWSGIWRSNKTTKDQKPSNRHFQWFKKWSIKKDKRLNEKDFQKLDTKGDGNCLLRAILKSTGNNELRFPELRQLVSDIIENSNLSEVGEDLFKEKKCKSKEDNISKIRKDNCYLGGIILEVLSKELKIIFGIYLGDDRYSNDPWKIIVPKDEDYKGVILLHLHQGVSCQTGHYSGIKLFDNHYLGNISLNSFKIKRQNNEIAMKDKNELKTVKLNTRSLNDFLKKLFIIDLLRSREIDIAFLQETFLIKTDKVYFHGYKIFRDANELSRRKGVMILVNKSLNIDI